MMPQLEVLPLSLIRPLPRLRYSHCHSYGPFLGSAEAWSLISKASVVGSVSCVLERIVLDSAAGVVDSLPHLSSREKQPDADC